MISAIQQQEAQKREAERRHEMEKLKHMLAHEIGYPQDEDFVRTVAARSSPNRNLTQQFDDAMQRVTQERGRTYGHPAVDFGRASAMKAVIADCPDPRLRHILDMIVTKAARLVETPGHLDSWIDIAGYARTACMVLDAKEKRHDEEKADEG